MTNTDPAEDQIRAACRELLLHLPKNEVNLDESLTQISLMQNGAVLLNTPTAAYALHYDEQTQQPIAFCYTQDDDGTEYFEGYQHGKLIEAASSDDIPDA